MNNRTWASVVIGTVLLGNMACATPQSGRQPRAAAQATFYRVWQGFQKPGLAPHSLEKGLPSFMKETVDLYGSAGILNQYLVVMPPKGKFANIPDELALVALASEDEYKAVRQTPAGQKYSDRHWDLFSKETASSAKKFVNYEVEKPAKLESGTAYSMFNPKFDWSEGYTLAFVGARKPSLSKDAFLDRLKNHIEMARDVMGPRGLQGYIVFAHDDYEVAYLNWNSQKAHDLTMKDPAAGKVFEDAEQIMERVMYEPAQKHIAGEEVDFNKVYLANAPERRALVVVTSHSRLGTTGKKTGYYLPEVAHPYAALVGGNIQVDIASINGGKAPLDPNSLDLKDPTNGRLFAESAFQRKISNTLRLDRVDLSQYQAILFAGGHGTMWDFRETLAVQRAIREVYERNGIVAAVCHGPAALVDVKLSKGEYLIAGKQVTGFTNEEENAVGLTNVMPFLLEDALTSRGATFSEAPLWQPKVVVDGRLVTGQNPASAEGVGEAIAELLKK